MFKHENKKIKNNRLSKIMVTIISVIIILGIISASMVIASNKGAGIATNAVNKIDEISINAPYIEDSKKTVETFFDAFAKSDFDTMKTLVTNDFTEQEYFNDEMCYGITKAELESCSLTNIDEFLNYYFRKSKQAQLTLSDKDIELLRSKSEDLAVYTVIIKAESGMNGRNKESTQFLNVICQKQNNGGYLIHKLVR